jgi:hypothetical protein
MSDPVRERIMAIRARVDRCSVPKDCIARRFARGHFFRKDAAALLDLVEALLAEREAAQEYITALRQSIYSGNIAVRQTAIQTRDDLGSQLTAASADAALVKFGCAS